MTTVKKKIPEPKPLEHRPDLKKVIDMLRTNDNGNRWKPERTVRFWIGPAEEVMIASVYLDDEGHIAVDLEDAIDPDESETEAEELARVEQDLAQAAKAGDD